MMMQLFMNYLNKHYKDLITNFKIHFRFLTQVFKKKVKIFNFRFIVTTAAFPNIYIFSNYLKSNNEF